MGQVLINPKTGLAEELEPELAQQKVQEGYLLPLFNQRGEKYTAPYDEAVKSVASGQYRQPNPEELHGLLNNAHFQEPSQQALAFTEGAARGIAGPLATAAETHLLNVNPTDILARKALNPGASMSGELGSLALGGLAMKGVFGAIKGASYLPTVGNLITKAAEAGTAGIATEGFFGQAAKAAATGAIESGLYAAQNQISEHMMGDPNSTAEHIISNIGISTILGAGIGGALQLGMGPFSKIVKSANAASEMVEKNLPEEVEAKMGIDPFTKEPIPLKTAAQPKSYAGFDPFTKQPLENQLKAWAPQVAEEAAPSLIQKVTKQAAEEGEKISPKEILELFTNPHEVIASKLTKMASDFSIKQIVKSFPEQASKVASLVSAFKTGAETLAGIEKETAGLFGYGASELAQQEEHSKTISPLFEKMNEIASNPEGLIDHMANSTGSFSSHMPDINVALSQTVAKAVNALNQVMPNLSKAAPLDQERELTPSQIYKFNDAANIINNPLLVIPKIKNGTLKTEHLAMLNAVYPNVLNSIRSEVLRQMAQHQAEERGPLNSKMRIGLSKLFGQNMDSSISNLAKNQVTLSGLRMTKQAQPTAPTRPSKTGIGRMKIPEQSETRAQQALQRKAS